LQAVLTLNDIDPLLSMIYHQRHWRAKGAKMFSYWSYTDKDRSRQNLWNV